MPTFGNGRRVAIVAGVRTPFTRAGTSFKALSAIELGKLCVGELLQRSNLNGKEVEALVFGTVVPNVLAPNIAREVSLMPMLPKGVQAFSVSRACASANQAITDAADQIALGHNDVIIAGGAESLSNVPILHSRGFADALVAASRAKSLGGRIAALARIRPKDLVPVTPAIAEPTTGETMGESAEKMAKINDISREDQDQFALRSHRLAAAGTADGRLTAEIVPVVVPPRYDTVVTTDNGVREDTSYEKLAALKPVFDRRYGTVTAGNSSPLTDGGACVLADERRKGSLARLHADGLHQIVCVRCARSRRAAADGAGARCAGRAGACGAYTCGHRSRRDARGVRRPGALQPQGVRVDGVGASRRIRAARSAKWIAHD